MWPVSLISAVEEATLIFRAAPLPQPAKVTLARMSQPHEPLPLPRHTLLPLFLLCNNQLATSLTLQPSNFYSPSILTFLRFGSRLTLSSIARGLYFFFFYFFVRLGRESLVATGGKRELTENPPLTSILGSPLYAPPAARRELQRAAEKAGVRSPGEHQRTSAGPETGPQRVQGMMGFFLIFFLSAAGHTVQQP